MIQRILVPKDVRPVSPEDRKKPALRLTTYMDERTVVPPELSDAPPLDGNPPFAALPLGVLVERHAGSPRMACEAIEIPDRQPGFTPRKFSTRGWWCRRISSR